MNHHRYFTIIWHEKGYKQWIGVLELLTHLSAQMFLLAMFYDIQVSRYVMQLCRSSWRALVCIKSCNS